MSIRAHLGLLILNLALGLAPGFAAQPEAAARGPRHFGTVMRSELRARDACVVPDPATRTYTMYFSSRGPNGRAAVVAYTSPDLESWTGPHVVFERPAEWWADRGIWAPEMHAYNGKYYLFLTVDSSHQFPEQWRGWRPRVKRGCQILESDSPLGPFAPFANRPTLPEDMMTLDGTLFVEDGVPHMVFCHEWVQIKDGTINFIELAPDLSGTVGEPRRLFHASDAPWARKQEPEGCTVTDGPWLHRTRSGKLLMLWSSFTANGYAVGIASSDSGRLAGPWKQSATPLFDRDGGHPMLFERFDGQLMLALHSPNRTPNERMHFIPVEEVNDTLVLKESSGAHLQLISPDGFAGSSVNVVAGLQSTLFSHGDVQYAAYYAHDRTLVLARRRLPAGAWELHRTGQSANVNDAHRTVALAVDGDGFLHVAWDHHNNPLNYARGTAPGSLELAPREPMTGRNESRVSYPQFLPLPDGDLLFFYRDGGSGRGNLVLNRYSRREKRWAQVHARLIDGENERSAYPALTVDRNGTLHLAWNWRDTPDVATNHDLCYARSADGGVTWTTSAGVPIAIPFTASNAEYALKIPTKRNLMNPPSVAADARGNPIIANYWCPEDSDIPQYHIVRFDGGGWRVSQVTHRSTPFSLSGGGTKRPPISRSVLLPVLVPHFRQTLHLVYRDDERGGRITAMSCVDLDAASPAWTPHDLTTESVGAWEPSLDPVAAGQGRLEMLVQRVEQRDGNDREAAAVPPTPVLSLSWSP